MAATAEQGTKKAPADEHVEIPLGPLTIRVTRASLTDAADRSGVGAPSMAKLVREAHRSIGASHGLHDRARRLDARNQRVASIAAVKVQFLRKPDGSKFTAAELAPLFTAVRMSLNAELRQQFRNADRQRAREERAEDKQRAADRKLRAKIEAKAAKDACAVILPEGAKPSKAASKDETRPAMCAGHVVKRGRGDTATWWLCVTDSYVAAAFPLQVTNPAAIAQTVIPLEALKAIEKAGAFRVTRKGAIQPLTVEKVNAATARANGQHGSIYWTNLHVREQGTGYMPIEGVDLALTFFGGRTKARRVRGIERTASIPARKVQGVLPDKPIPAARRLELTLNAQLLAQLQAAFTKGTNVTLELDAGDFERGPDKVRRRRYTGGGAAIRVRDYRDDSIVAVQMPVNPDKAR